MPSDGDDRGTLAQVRGKSGMMLTIKPAGSDEDGLDWLFRISDEIVSDETRELMKRLPPDIFDAPAHCTHLSDGVVESLYE